MAKTRKSGGGFVLAIAAIALSACANDYPPLSFDPDGSALRLNGVIDERALAAFEAALLAQPETRELIFEFVPGSVDDESNLILARRVRAMGLITTIQGDGLVASGGTDLFLAGVSRTIEPGACLGVHTWGNTLTGIGSETPKDDPIHQWYLDYYRDVGIDGAFYWFTLDAAGPDDSHWMSPDELERYRIGTILDPADATADPGEEVCEARFNTGFQNLLDEAGEPAD